jgi:hypothetical protein
MGGCVTREMRSSAITHRPASAKCPALLGGVFQDARFADGRYPIAD